MGLTIYQVVIESYKKNSNGVDTINQSGWYMSQVYHSLGQALKHYEVCQKRVFDKHLPVKCIGRGQCKDIYCGITQPHNSRNTRYVILVKEIHKW